MTDKKENKGELSFVQKCVNAVKSGAEFLWKKVKAAANWCKNNKVATACIAITAVVLAAIASAVSTYNNSPYNSVEARTERNNLRNNYWRRRNRAERDYARARQKAEAAFSRSHLDSELQLESEELEAEILLEEGLEENANAYAMA